jgi:hypothetical protein
VANWLTIAARAVGVREKGRPNHGPEVKMYLASVGLDQGYAWCMAFAQFTFSEACRISRASKSLIRGASVRTVYRQMKAKGSLRSPSFAAKRGQMMCFMKPGTQYGHVAIVLENLGNGKVRTIEGNTGPDGGRDGDGVYIKIRPIEGYTSLRTEGYISFE